MGQEGESKVTELVTEQMPAKFWVYFKAPGLSTMPEEGSLFPLCFLPRSRSSLDWDRDIFMLHYSEELPRWAVGRRRIKLDARRPGKWLKSHGKVLGLLLLLLLL